MKSLILSIISLFLLISCKTEMKKIDYPVTRKGNVADTFFGTVVSDPYRWLEDDNSEEVKAWVQEENKVTFGYLEKIPYRQEIKERLTKMFNYEKYGLPFRAGDYTYFTKNDGLQNQYVYYRQKDGGEPELFLDPNKFSADGTTSLGEIGFTKDGSRMAYTISEGGSDWRKVIIMDAITKTIIDDTIKNVKFSGIAWQGNEGFYYSTYDRPQGNLLTAMTDHQRLYFHKIGTSQSDDKVVFGDNLVRRYLGEDITEDGRFLIVSAAESTTGNELYIKDLSKKNSEFITIVGNFNSNNSVILNEGSKLFIYTNLNAPNGKIVTVDAAGPGPENWKDFIPETDNVLEPSSCSGFIFANYLKDAISYIKQYDLTGKDVREISLPGIGSAGGFSGHRDDRVVYYAFTNYITPPEIFSMNPQSGEAKIYKKPEVMFRSEDYTSEQVFYNSKDGTKIPMIITCRKDLQRNGKNPTILYGYGGFSISMTPGFSITNALWLEMGGVYAVPNIRGGGEYGEKWHLEGTRMNKQNVFDDFIAAAQYLIDNKYTSHDFLAIRGGSNGGLLIGAVMTQRPDLMKVALPAVGVMDMLRYNKFTAGAGWAYDFGTAEESQEMFRYLFKYSPVQNVREGVEYPATLVTTADHDDRVVPAHSFKFTAELQAKQKGTNPVLIRIETKAGHGGGTPVSKQIEQTVDAFGFTLWNMGFRKLPK